jgi:hypothetical protein
VTTAASLVGVIFLAGLIEFLAEQTFGQFLTGKWMKLVAVAAGLAVALIFRVGLIQGLNIAGIDMSATGAEWADYVLTGLIIGAGSTKVHEFLDKYLVKA